MDKLDRIKAFLEDAYNSNWSDYDNGEKGMFCEITPAYSASVDSKGIRIKIDRKMLLPIMHGEELVECEGKAMVVFSRVISKDLPLKDCDPTRKPAGTPNRTARTVAHRENSRDRSTMP